MLQTSVQQGGKLDLSAGFKCVTCTKHTLSRDATNTKLFLLLRGIYTGMSSQGANDWAPKSKLNSEENWRNVGPKSLPVKILWFKGDVFLPFSTKSLWSKWNHCTGHLAEYNLYQAQDSSSVKSTFSTDMIQSGTLSSYILPFYFKMHLQIYLAEKALLQRRPLGQSSWMLSLSGSI